LPPFPLLESVTVNPVFLLISLQAAFYIVAFRVNTLLGGGDDGGSDGTPTATTDEKVNVKMEGEVHNETKKQVQEGGEGKEGGREFLLNWNWGRILTR
jgi:hypothetical protein